MPLLAGEVMDEAAAVYLNDAARSRWPNSVLIPYLRSAIGELQSELESNDLPPLHEIGALIPVAPGEKEVFTPPDFVFPIRLTERGENEERFIDMQELSWEPAAEPKNELRFWVFREGKIQVLGATSNRVVRLQYLRSLSSIVNENSVIELPNAKGFLAARTASLASHFGGSATQRASLASERASYFLRLVISSLTKRLQDRPVRRRRYRWR